MTATDLGHMEISGINVHPQAYMPTREGLSVPCIALEIGATTFAGAAVRMTLALAPDLVEALVVRLSQALADAQAANPPRDQTH